MASEAFRNVEKAMDTARDAEIAAYILRDVELRQQNALENGVLAYGKKPIPRSIPNQRFLQNTLKSVDFANRSAREKELWETWEAQKKRRRGPEDERERERKKAKRRSKKSKEDRVACESEARNLSESGSEHADSDCSKCSSELDGILKRTAPRGRGGTGPRADDTGPFLFPTDEQERKEYEMMRHAPKVVAGPECPTWIRAEIMANNQDQGGRFLVRPKSNSSLGEEEICRKQELSTKSKKKARKLKKEFKMKRKKEGQAHNAELR